MVQRAVVYGPAYLDRVVRVDSPLVEPHLNQVIDRSFDGLITPSHALELIDDAHSQLSVELPNDWRGPTGNVHIVGELYATHPTQRTVKAIEARDDLGGMGAGYAKALGGLLVSALGTHDPMRCVIESLLNHYGLASEPINIVSQTSDWTLLISSGPYGDKLAVGFRGCHASINESRLTDVGRLADNHAETRVVVVAGLPNNIAATILNEWVHRRVLRVFAPARRNVCDRSYPISRLASMINVFTCNSDEWRALADSDRHAVENHVRWLLVTDGPRGARIRHRRQEQVTEVTTPAFPRRRPPVDTNRAGEAFAACILNLILEDSAKRLDGRILQLWATRASAAAALELDYPDFRFPTPDDIDHALVAGEVV